MIGNPFVVLDWLDSWKRKRESESIAWMKIERKIREESNKDRKLTIFEKHPPLYLAAVYVGAILLLGPATGGLVFFHPLGYLGIALILKGAFMLDDRYNLTRWTRHIERLGDWMMKKGW